MFWKLPLLLPLVLAVLPSTNTYQLNSYGFGSGGTANSSTGNYSLEGISGEISSQPESTSAYSALPGFSQTQQANVPTITLTNPSNYYDKLHFVLSQQGNPSDALYALQIGTTTTTCASQSDIKYVKSDDTIGASLTLADYQTYAAWGGGSGANIIGLAANTTYCLQAKATQGKFTESAYGPAASAATVGQSISYCVYTTACGSANSINFGGLTAGTVSDAPNNINVDFSTNADFGGNVYIYSKNGGLQSASSGGSISTATADLSSAASGFGAQVTGSGQSAGGPFSKQPPFDQSGNTVGGITISALTIFSSSSPVTGGSGTILLKAKPSTTTPESTDYSETITLVAAASF